MWPSEMPRTTLPVYVPGTAYPMPSTEPKADPREKPQSSYMPTVDYSDLSRGPVYQSEYNSETVDSG